MARPRILIPYGARFGHLIVLDEAAPIPREYPASPARALLVRCDCGCETVVRLDNLRTGNTVSCGHVSRSVVGRREKTPA